MVFSHPEFKEHQDVIFIHDNATKLKAIIAIHNTNLGPALGGCRVWNYKSEEAALRDVLRLSRGMTYKAALASLQIGGGKSVILKDNDKGVTREQFLAFGQALQHLGGRYITAEDVGTTTSDMEIIREKTSFVVGRARSTGQGSGNPSPVTAYGILMGIKAAVKFWLKQDALTGLKVAIQGLGNVGFELCRLLHNEGVQLFVTDISAEAIERAAYEFGAYKIGLDDIYKQPVDIFAPCALGAILNETTIPQLKASIVAGAANNQLDTAQCGESLMNKGILYVPDYLINAGGLINVTYEGPHYQRELVLKHVEKIYDTAIEIFERAATENLPTNIVADRVAENRFNCFT